MSDRDEFAKQILGSLYDNLCYDPVLDNAIEQQNTETYKEMDELWKKIQEVREAQTRDSPEVLDQKIEQIKNDIDSNKKQGKELAKNLTAEMQKKAKLEKKIDQTKKVLEEEPDDEDEQETLQNRKNKLEKVEKNIAETTRLLEKAKKDRKDLKKKLQELEEAKSTPPKEAVDLRTIVDLKERYYALQGRHLTWAVRDLKMRLFLEDLERLAPIPEINQSLAPEEYKSFVSKFLKSTQPENVYPAVLASNASTSTSTAKRTIDQMNDQEVAAQTSKRHKKLHQDNGVSIVRPGSGQGGKTITSNGPINAVALLGCFEGSSSDDDDDEDE